MFSDLLCLREVVYIFSKLGENSGNAIYFELGGGRKGILYGPAMGATLADLITNKALDLDIAAYELGASRSK